MAAVPADPWSAGIMGLSSVANNALKPASSGATSNNSSAFDNSGFVVNIGGGTASSTKTALPTTAQALGAAAASATSLLGNPMFIIAIGVGLFLFLKHR